MQATALTGAKLLTAVLGSQPVAASAMYIRVCICNCICKCNCYSYSYVIIVVAMFNHACRQQLMLFDHGEVSIQAAAST